MRNNQRPFPIELSSFYDRNVSMDAAKPEIEIYLVCNVYVHYYVHGIFNKNVEA